MEKETLYHIALADLFRNQTRKGLALLEQFGSATEAWKHISAEGASKSLKRAEKEVDFIEQNHVQVSTCLDESYPYRLRQCPDRPLVLFSLGNLNPNQGKMISIVGTRSGTERGKETTRQFVLDLADKTEGVTIISGLAYGVDIAAHRAAIEAGLQTLIVPAHGLDMIYPSLHRPVAVQALRHGGILTEYMSKTTPLQMNFVARNRIVAGLADAVVVIESKAKGGSLITAQMALDYDRDVFAFPGRPTDEDSRGCNDLIRSQKAMLIEGADDLINAMQWEPKSKPVRVQTELDLFGLLSDTQKKLLTKLHEQEDGMHINMVVMEMGMPYADVSAELMMMEMHGFVKALPGGIYRALK